MRYVLKAIVESDNSETLRKARTEIIKAEKYFPENEYLDIVIYDTDTGTVVE